MDILTEKDSQWLEGLALDEMNMQQSGIVHINDHLNIDVVLEEESISFMEKLKEYFEIYTYKFNSFRDNSDPQALVKLFKISNTVNDFMLYRNSLKLIISRKNKDLITMALYNHRSRPFEARNPHQKPSENSVTELKAHVGAFNKIRWLFQGETLDTEALVKHYFTDFVRLSAH